MAPRGRELKVYLTADTTKFGRGLKQAETRAQKFKGIVGGALAGVAAAAGAMAVKLGVDAVQAAIDDEASQARLAKALENTTGATTDQIAAMEDYISTAQEKSGLDDGALRRGVELLARVTGDLTQAQELANLSMDIAVQTGKDYETVAKAVGLAAKGSTAPLRRLGIVLADGIDPIKELNRQFAGGAAADAETYAGQIRRVSTAADELLESFGAGVLGGAGGGPGNQIRDLSAAMYDAQPTVEAWGRSIGEAAAAIMALVTAAYEAKDALDDNPLLNAALESAGKMIAGPTVLVGQGVEKFQQMGTPPAGSTQTPYFSSGDLYSPARVGTRSNDATGRGDARAAQRAAKTREQQ